VRGGAGRGLEGREEEDWRRDMAASQVDRSSARVGRSTRRRGKSGRWGGGRERRQSSASSSGEELRAQ